MLSRSSIWNIGYKGIILHYIVSFICLHNQIVIASPVVSSPALHNPSAVDSSTNSISIKDLPVHAISILKKLHSKKHYEPISDEEYYLVLAIICVFVILGGIFAGLTLGLMSLDSTNLSILKISGTPTEQAYAARIEPIRRNTHLLLVTLLLSNTVINETLPILFDTIHLKGYQAVLCSTILIVIFGEIIPQAVCARYGLRVGAFFAWPVRILMWIMWVIAFPVAKLLDFVLGHRDGVIYRRSELRELVALHGEDQAGPLSKDEVSVLRAVLDLKDKSVAQIMTHLEDVFMISLDATLNRTLLAQILLAGHSRVPVYAGDRTNIIGVVLVKELILNDPDDNTPVSSLKIRKLPHVQLDMPLFDMLHVFETGGSHMALVLQQTSDDDPEGRQHLKMSLNDMDHSHSRRGTSFHLSSATPVSSCRHDTHDVTSETIAEEELESGDLQSSTEDTSVPDDHKSPVLHGGEPSRERCRLPFRTVGIVTLEDVIEELLGEEIIDETDVYVDVRTKVRVVRAFKEFRKDKGLGEQLRNLLTSPFIRPSAPSPSGTLNSRQNQIQLDEDERQPLLGGPSKSNRPSVTESTIGNNTSSKRKKKDRMALVNASELAKSRSNASMIVDDSLFIASSTGHSTYVSPIREADESGPHEPPELNLDQ